MAKFQQIIKLNKNRYLHHNCETYKNRYLHHNCETYENNFNSYSSLFIDKDIYIGCEKIFIIRIHYI